MYATSLLVCAILAQAPTAPEQTQPAAAQTQPATAETPPAPIAESAGSAPAEGARSAKGPASNPAGKSGGYDTPAPPFEAGTQETPSSPLNTSGAAAKESATETPPAGQQGVEPARKHAAEGQGAGERAEPPIDKSLVPVQPRSSLKNLPSEVLNNAIALPEGSPISGRPMKLVDALRQAPDRTAQRRATEDYWKLVEALAGYNFAWDEYSQLERLKPATKPEAESTPDEQVMHTRMSASKARLHDAERAIINAQYDLAATIKLPAGQPLPLASDPPHVGPYNTLLYDLYQKQGKIPPPRAVLLDRILPIRRSAVDARASAVQAATDALDAAEEAHYAGRADLKLVLSLIDDLILQRRAFISDVRAYNNEILEYVMGVSPPPGGAPALASMLILPTPTAGANSGVIVAGGATTGATAGAAGAIERAGYNSPVEQPPGAVTGANSPAATGSAQPSAARQNGASPPNAAPAAATQKPGEPTLAPPRGAPDRREPGKLPIDEPPPPAANYRANRLQTGVGEEPTANAAAEQNLVADPAASQDHSLYPALLRMPPDEQAKHLASILFWQPADGTPDVAPISLAEYLAGIRPEGRKTALAAYWSAQRMAAIRGALVAQVEQFDSLDQELQRSIATLDPAAPLLVRAARSAAEADARRAEAECKAAQWDLAMRMGRPATGAWLAPATTPHAGGYRLNVEQLPATLRESSEWQRLAANISRRAPTFCDRAAAVVGSDKTRSDEVTHTGGTLAGAEQAALAIHAQTGYTIAFAEELAEYNRELADYALLVLPAAIPTPTLVQALVLTK
ncbi:MAG TPA: hypothetical protein VGJ26_13655 [Pirellulales bacterium]